MSELLIVQLQVGLRAELSQSQAPEQQGGAAGLEGPGAGGGLGKLLCECPSPHQA